MTKEDNDRITKLLSDITFNAVVSTIFTLDKLLDQCKTFEDFKKQIKATKNNLAEELKKDDSEDNANK